jgi:hypothetical protein
MEFSQRSYFSSLMSNVSGLRPENSLAERYATGLKYFKPPCVSASRCFERLAQRDAGVTFVPYYSSFGSSAFPSGAASPHPLPRGRTAIIRYFFRL